jgi:hypothetical protein
MRSATPRPPGLAAPHDQAGVSPWGNTGVTIVSMRIVPPMDRGTAWINIAAAGRSAEVRATLPLSSQ